MNAHTYIVLIREKIMPSIEQPYTDHDYIYQDDYNSVHRAKNVLEFIKEYMPNRIMPEYRASKLDNIWPIENAWAII
ncbi:unnamed protein product [Rotaria sp. Silwood2]|nr:unnamed protein product [Rotaria sp. Silwood2]CAF4488359.1 unnamed protein product [Rotaria sp. Silwood2]